MEMMSEKILAKPECCWSCRGMLAFPTKSVKLGVANLGLLHGASTLKFPLVRTHQHDSNELQAVTYEALIALLRVQDGPAQVKHSHDRSHNHQGTEHAATPP